MKKWIMDACIRFERQIISIFKANGLVTKNSTTFSNAKLTEHGKEVLQVTDPIIPPNNINNWRLLWPAGYRGDFATVQKQMGRYLRDEPYDMKTITDATKLWLTIKETPYHGSANNFFYHIKNNVECSRCTDAIMELKNMPEIPGDQLLTDEYS